MARREKREDLTVDSDEALTIGMNAVTAPVVLNETLGSKRPETFGA